LNRPALRVAGDALPATARRRIERLLGRHRPCDGVEHGHLERIQRFLAAHDAPFSRANPRGHLTGSAFVIDPTGRLLLLHHRKLGLWVQPGGHADGEIDPLGVALREAREETGLADLRVHPWLGPYLLDVDVHAIPARRDVPAHEHFDLRFLLATSTPEAAVLQPAEALAMAWLSPRDAARRGDDGIERALRHIAALGQA
jgi:8-oxo-dGTP pyrophosphatase MutT (NUDIX family)